MAGHQDPPPGPERRVGQRARHAVTLCDDPAIATVRILGAGGWIPTGAHATCAALLRAGDAAVLIDAGSGVERLVAEPALLEGVERLDLVLTHFHLDHVVGLAYLPGLRKAGGIPPRIWGPARALTGGSTDAVLRTIYAPPFYDADYGLIAAEVRELGEEQAIGPFTLRTRLQRGHSTPTLALRFDDLLTYCTDTPYDAGNSELAVGSRVLMHEAWCTEGSPEETPIHSSGRDAGTVAKEARVERLVLIHLHPRGGHAAVLEEAREVFDGAELGSDAFELEF